MLSLRTGIAYVRLHLSLLVEADVFASSYPKITERITALPLSIRRPSSTFSQIFHWDHLRWSVFQLFSVACIDLVLHS